MEIINQLLQEHQKRSHLMVPTCCNFEWHQNDLHDMKWLK